MFFSTYPNRTKQGILPNTLHSSLPHLYFFTMSIRTAKMLLAVLVLVILIQRKSAFSENDFRVQTGNLHILKSLGFVIP